MKQILVVGEDDLSCALGQQLLEQVLPSWTLSGKPINTRGITKLIPRLPGLIEQSRYVRPVLCVADTDNACPVKWLNKRLPNGAPDGFFLRLAVPESESWVLADRQGTSEFFKIAMAQVHPDPEQLADPKREMLRLAKKSKIRQISEEMVSSTDVSKQGSGYNAHLSALVHKVWRAKRASERSPSLNRAIQRLAEFGELHR